jgi:hypothetical protein
MRHPDTAPMNYGAEEGRGMATTSALAACNFLVVSSLYISKVGALM